VAGARPNFMKIAPLCREFQRYKSQFKTLLIHTGQHYDFEMSETFFKDLKIPKPYVHLNIGSGTHTVQTANVMTAFEKVLLKEKPCLVIVVGDVNSTLACSLVATKMDVKVAHVEAGLRSFDRSMPEEVNRIVTDSLSDYLFVSEESGCQNLKKEGIHRKKIHFVGNTMIDTLLFNMPKINKSKILNTLDLKPNTYAVMSLHRPSNVDFKEPFIEILDVLKSCTKKIKLVYPVHPRAKKMMLVHALKKDFDNLDNLLMIDPLGYIDFMNLIKKSRFALTDSGGIQEETTVLKIPCLTMRENTERPVTIDKGTNILVGRNKARILKNVNGILKRESYRGRRAPRLWDGKTAQRIVKILSQQI
jgi:UDP-N-acetylglucosamine 2-epimerase (non-hydrolysing)